MELPSLLGHSAQLLRILLKSSQQSDEIASSYFRSKKYIGSKERNFISELVFTSIRLKTLTAYLTDKYIIDENIANYMQLKAINNESTYKEILYVATTCVLAPIYNINNVLELNLKNAINNIFKDEQNFFLIFSQALAKSLPESPELTDFPNKIREYFYTLNSQIIEILSKNLYPQPDFELLSTRFSLPEWMIKLFVENPYNPLSMAEAASLADSLNANPPISLRVNSPQKNRDEIIATLNDLGIQSRRGQLSPSAINLNKRTALNTLDLFRSGQIDIQDEASQIVGFVVNPKPGEDILDACAGAGGKSLHLASLSDDKANIFATDIEFNRLKEIKYRAARFGFKSITTFLINNNIKNKDKRHGKTINKNSKNSVDVFSKLYDAVLVDAPCSGLGTVRRAPSQKWKYSIDTINRIAAKQLEILEHYSQFVRIGGRLIYSTCSMLYIENDDVIQKFLQNNPDFEPYPFNNEINEFNLNIHDVRDNTHKITLLPSVYGCDGFFVARFRKIN